MNRVWLATGVVFLLFYGSGKAYAQLNVQALEARGLAVTQSPHLTLITDVRDRADVAEFNDVFEAAVGQWCEYFEIPRAAVRDWHLTGCVIRDPRNKQRFVEAGLFPDDLPPFPAGFQQESSIWVYLQDGDYYTRHLLIHEGTHAFMEKFLGGYGAPWYAEGIAELLGVHRWQDGQLTINHQITNREEAPFWGRVKLVRKERDAGKGKTLNEVIAMDNNAFREVHTYGWAWAACQFFDQHPEFQTTFRKLPALASLPPEEFNRKFLRAMKEQWPSAQQQWQILVDEIEYGYDVEMATPVDAEPFAINESAATLILATNRGWQSTGIRLQRGERIRISAEGKFQVKNDGTPWPCDAGGVTIEYYNGRPLGRLMAAIRSSDNEAALEIIDVGNERRFRCDSAGELYLRINESPAAWTDNTGSLKVTVETDSD